MPEPLSFAPRHARHRVVVSSHHDDPAVGARHLGDDVLGREVLVGHRDGGRDVTLLDQGQDILSRLLGCRYDRDSRLRLQPAAEQAGLVVVHDRAGGARLRDAPNLLLEADFAPPDQCDLPGEPLSSGMSSANARSTWTSSPVASPSPERYIRTAGTSFASSLPADSAADAPGTSNENSWTLVL